MTASNFSENAEKLFSSLSQKNSESKPLKAIIKGNQALNEFQLQHFKTPGRKFVNPQEKIEQELQQLKHQLQIAENNLSAAEKAFEQRLDKETQKAYERGKAEGMAEAYEKAQQEFNEKFNAFASETSTSLESISAAYDSRCKELESQAVDLSIGHAQRLFCILSAADQQIISNVISEGMGYLGQEEELTIIVNPHDEEWAQESQSFWLPLSSAVRNIKISADDRVQRGGCIIESAKGAQIELAIDKILAKFEDAVRNHYQLYQSNE